jgi:hypothetical protein
MGAPCYANTRQQVMHSVVIEGLRPTFPPNCPAAYVDLALACMAASPTARPSFDQVGWGGVRASSTTQL